MVDVMKLYKAEITSGRSTCAVIQHNTVYVVAPDYAKAESTLKWDSTLWAHAKGRRIMEIIELAEPVLLSTG